MLCCNFNHTITTKDTFLPLLLDGFGIQTLALNMLKELPGLLLTLLGLKARAKMREQLFDRFFRGWSEARFTALCEYSAQRHGHLLRPHLMLRLEDAIALSEDVVIISSDLEPLIKAYLKDYPEMVVVGQTLDSFSGTLSGRFRTEPLEGLAKVRKLLEMYPDRKSYRLIAFGSGREDIAMLDFADEGHYLK